MLFGFIDSTKIVKIISGNNLLTSFKSRWLAGPLRQPLHQSASMMKWNKIKTGGADVKLIDELTKIGCKIVSSMLKHDFSVVHFYSSLKLNTFDDAAQNFLTP